MKKKTIKDVDVKSKKILLRCDFNVPLNGQEITDDNRIVEALPTIKYLLDRGAKLVLCSHLGRPKGQFNNKYSLKPVADRLNKYLDGKVEFANDIIGEDAKNKVANLTDGRAVLLENLRFHAQEEANEKEFCRQLSQYCEIYVGDAFGTAHRAHASTAGIVQHGFVQEAVAGLLMQKEIEFLSSALDKPSRPFLAILGGAKVSDKIPVIKNLLNKVDTLLIGGGMAYTFIAASGGKIGTSLCEQDKIALAKELMFSAKDKGVKLLLPTDIRATHDFPNPIDKPATSKIVAANDIPDDMMGLDIGPKTQQLFGGEIKQAKTIVWNGPMGVFENPTFADGTNYIARAVADSDAVSIIGGGDSAAAVIKCGLKNKIAHVSTGGGASLEMLEGKELPGIACLNDK